MNNPIKTLTKKEWILWLGSLLIVVISNIMTGKIDSLTLTAALIGATSLIFAAKGNVWAQILMIILWIIASIKDPAYFPVVVNFMIFFLNDMYGFISWKKREAKIEEKIEIG